MQSLENISDYMKKIQNLIEENDPDQTMPFLDEIYSLAEQSQAWADKANNKIDALIKELDA